MKFYKDFVFSESARSKILSGVEVLAKAVSVTLGPGGRNVMIQRDYGPPHGTKDGVTVAKDVFLKDPFENMAAQMIKQVAQKTAEVAGDGTTTATVLAEALIKEGFRLVAADHNPTDLKRGIDFAVDKIVEELGRMSVNVTSDREIEQIGTLSANGDDEIGKMIAEAMRKIGNDGVINIEESARLKTELILSSGYQFDRGYLHDRFATNDKLESVLEKPLVLVTDEPITNVNVIMPILTKCNDQIHGRPLFVIAEDVAGDALHTMVLNNIKGSFKSCCVKAPGFGDRRIEMMRDIATLVGATFVSASEGLQLANFEMEWLGSAKRIVTKKHSCAVIEGGGNPEDVKALVDTIRNAMDMSDDSWDRQRQEERLAKLAGGVAIISVGGATETEIMEKKDRIEDALSATRAAVQEGIVPGGGVALLRAKKVLDSVDCPPEFREGVNIVKKAVEEPLRRIVLNAGGDATLVRLKVLDSDDVQFGYNAKTAKFENLFESGVIDPAKVVRCALQNAASVAGMALMTDCMIATEIEETSAK